MSQENVEILRGMCDAFIVGDAATALAGLDDEVEWHGTIGGLDEGRTYHGHDQVIEGFVDNLQAWESHSLETRRYIDAGDKVVVFWHEVGRGKESGVDVENDTAVIYTIRGGKVVDVQGYMDRDAALEAVGLSE